MISPSLVQRWIDLVGAERVYQSYGMTEGIGLCAIRGDEWLEHRGSVGRGYRETEIRILDPDGNELPAGETGEIYMRSPSSGMFQYLGGATPAPHRRRLLHRRRPRLARPRVTCTSSTGAST